jgi:hypothetical protein
VALLGPPVCPGDPIFIDPIFADCMRVGKVPLTYYPQREYAPRSAPVWTIQTIHEAAAAGLVVAEPRSLLTRTVVLMEVVKGSDKVLSDGLHRIIEALGRLGGAPGGHWGVGCNFCVLVCEVLCVMLSSVCSADQCVQSCVIGSQFI